MQALKLAISPAALCLWAIVLCISFSVAGWDAGRTVAFRQVTKFGWAQTTFPTHMKRWDEALFLTLSARAKNDMAEFLKSAEQEANAKPIEEEANWKPYTQTVGYLEQFRTASHVSYLEVTTVTLGDAQPAISFRTVNFDTNAGKELSLTDFIEGAADRSKALEALANYARADIKEQTGEEEDESEALIDLTKPDLGIYEKFTLCPSTKMGKSAGLTIHFPPAASAPYAASDFHVTIPYTVFAKFLKPGVKPLFSGEPRATPVSLQDLES
jgi:hypothetical protein